MKIKSMTKLVRRGSARLVRRGTKKFKKAEKAGDLETLRRRMALATQLIEVAMLATAVAKGLRIGKAAKPARRVARKTKARA